ncbi:MAG: P1 [Corcyphos virus 3]|nr:MAG: P1 [Corcyphos virus 3]
MLTNRHLLILRNELKQFNRNIALSVKLAYSAKLAELEFESSEILLGIDSSIFTNLGSQISTLYTLTQQALRYTDRLILFPKYSQSYFRFPGICQIGNTGPEVYLDSHVTRTYTPDPNPYVFDVVNGYVIKNRVHPHFALNFGLPDGLIYWEYSGSITAPLKQSYTDTIDIVLNNQDIDTADINQFAYIIIRVKVVIEPFSDLGYFSVPDQRVGIVQWSADESFWNLPSLKRPLVFNREIKKYGNQLYELRTGQLLGKFPDYGCEIISFFIVTPNASVAPTLKSYDGGSIKFSFGLTTVTTSITSLTPGDYLADTGEHYYGFFAQLSDTVFTSSLSGQICNLVLRSPLVQRQFVNQQLRYEIDRPTVTNTASGSIQKVEFDFHMTTMLEEDVRIHGYFTDANTYTNDGYWTSCAFDCSVTPEPHGAFIMISLANEPDITLPKNFAYAGEQVTTSQQSSGWYTWAGYLYEHIFVTFDNDFSISCSVPVAPDPQDQLYIFNERDDEVQASLQMLFQNWYNDHQQLMDLRSRVDRLEKIIDELIASSEVDFWINLFSSIVDIVLPQIPVGSLLSSLGSKLAKGFTKVFPRKGNSYSWNLADSFASSRYSRITDIPYVRLELVDDFAASEQTFKNLITVSSGIEKRVAYGLENIDEIEDELADLFTVSARSSYIEHPERVKADIVMHTGLSTADSLITHIDQNSISELVTHTGAVVDDIPLSNAKFYVTPFNFLGEKVGDFLYRRSAKVANVYDQEAADAYFTTNKRLVHSYMKSEVYMANPTNDGMLAQFTYIGVAEGIDNRGLAGNAVGAVTFELDVLGKGVDGNWVTQLKSFEESIYTEEILNSLMINYFGESFSDMLLDDRYQMLYDFLSKRELQSSRLIHRINVPDISRLRAIGMFATETSWVYNILKNNCQTFNRNMYQWLRNGIIPPGEDYELLTRAYARSVQELNSIYSGNVLSKQRGKSSGTQNLSVLKRF